MTGAVIVLDDYVQAREGSSPLRVLIADGQPLVRAGFRALLQESGRMSVVGEASTFAQAVELARRTRPDVAVVDAGLTGRVEAIGELPVRVMLLTSSADDDRLLAAVRAGAQGLLVKDSAPGELVSGIEALARGDAPLSPCLARRLLRQVGAFPERHTPQPECLTELTPREREVLVLVGLGFTNTEIAERLVITLATAKTHVSRVMMKLHAHHRAALVVAAYEGGLVVPGTAA
jgi:DNA-binding NarL/FixJ family response regulator